MGFCGECLTGVWVVEIVQQIYAGISVSICDGKCAYLCT